MTEEKIKAMSTSFFLEALSKYSPLVTFYCLILDFYVGSKWMGAFPEWLHSPVDILILL